MPTYVVATCQESQTGSLTAEDHVRQVSGVWVKGGTDPNRITIEASEFAAAEIERRFGSVLLIEPELTSDAEAQRARWLENNKDAIEAHNAMIERDGLPLDEFRQF
jgi:hypothetical protein